MATEILDQAFAEASRLSSREQEVLATMILKEIASERRWEKAFAESEDTLALLAEEALVEHREGRTQVLDPDRL